MELLTGNAELCALLRADGHEEALVALVAKLLDGDVLTDLNAAFELNAHGPEHVDLGVYNVLLKTEGGDAHGEHTAGNGVFIEHGDIAVAHFRKEEGAAHAGGAGADDGDLLFEEALVLGLYHGRDIAGLGVQIALCDEFLDLVDRNCTVDAASRAGILAAAVAYGAADRREGICLLYERQSLGIAALSRHLQVALNGDMSRTRGLAGGGAGFVAVDAVIIAVVEVKLLGTPVIVIGQLMLGILNGAVLGAELLTELYGARGTVFDAAAAGHAVGGVDSRNVC